MTARFAPSDPVRVRPGAKPGRVESGLGRYRNPEDLAYGLSGEPRRPLYKLGFRQDALWPDYEGPSDERLYADVYEHWLKPGGESWAKTTVTSTGPPPEAPRARSRPGSGGWRRCWSRRVW